MRGVVRILAAALAVSLVSGAALARDDSQLLYRYRKIDDKHAADWDDGKFGPIIKFQRALRQRLERAGKRGDDLPAADGDYGKGTQKAIVALLTLNDFRDLAPATGQLPAITEALWSRLMPAEPTPTAEQRAMTLVFTYEGTPYDKTPEWNFCQRVDSATRRSTPPCVTDDYLSYLTWGPRGATAGGGREIQGVLIAVDQASPKLIDAAFLDEAAAVRRFLHLRERRRAPAVLDSERYLCGVWMDADRADRWGRGFASLGANELVQKTYENLFQSSDFDGAKIRALFALYKRLGRTPTEIDFAFFLDRATQTSGLVVGDEINTEAAIEAVALLIEQRISDPRQAKAWEIRRLLSILQVPPNEIADRNGRDVAFFVDGLDVSNLTADELANWDHRDMRHAIDVGLSDERSAVWSGPTEGSFPTLVEPVGTLTDTEMKACPIWVLNWTNWYTRKTRSPLVIDLAETHASPSP